MEKVVSAFDARRQFGSLLHDVDARHDKIIVTRHGEPVAALVPISVYEQWKQRRERFFQLIEDIQTHANMTQEEADELIAEALEATRPARR
jgi:prevent-host-death family protein